MNTITKLLILIILSITVSANAQDVKQDSLLTKENLKKIELLEKQKNKIKNQERESLKQEVEAINVRLDNNEISTEEADELKRLVAKKRALNIENRVAIVDNKIALLKRNESISGETVYVRIGGNDDTSASFLYIGDKLEDKPRKYDLRTKTDVVFAFGFNNTLIDGQSLDDSPYKIGGSGFVELGYAWKTRLFKDTNFWRLKYGFSFQWNKLDIKDHQYFVNTDGAITLETFPVDADKIKFRTTNLVIPVHLEFGPSKKIERENYFRYSTRKQFKMGLGGYAGLNIGSMQKLKYRENGDRVKDKQRGDFEVNDFVYGLSGYVAWGSVALYAKYDLNPLFKNQAVDQNNISLGVRFDMD